MTSSQFLELLLCLMFLKSNQFKIISMPNRHVLGVIHLARPLSLPPSLPALLLYLPPLLPFLN